MDIDPDHYGVPLAHFLAIKVLDLVSQDGSDNSLHLRRFSYFSAARFHLSRAHQVEALTAGVTLLSTMVSDSAEYRDELTLRALGLFVKWANTVPNGVEERGALLLLARAVEETMQEAVESVKRRRPASAVNREISRLRLDMRTATDEERREIVSQLNALYRELGQT